MAISLDDETTQLIILFALLLVFIVVILILTRKYSKKPLRRWLKSREDRVLKSDKAFNTLQAVKIISKNFEGQGIDVRSVKGIIEGAEVEMELKNYTSTIELAERAKALLIELKSKKDREEDKQPEPKPHEIDAKDFEPSRKEGYEPTAKEMLHKKYPQNYFESKFTIGVAEEMLRNSKDKDVTSEAKTLLEQSKYCFEIEDYAGALRYSAQCKKLLEGAGIEAVREPIQKMKEKLECPKCKYESNEYDIFCRKCGIKLKN